VRFSWETSEVLTKPVASEYFPNGAGSQHAGMKHEQDHSALHDLEHVMSEAAFAKFLLAMTKLLLTLNTAWV
jgi:hypothetical protein